METTTDEQRVHTYLDDIRFQAVKGNNKRTSFVSSDYQIVAKNAQVIKDIEKNEKVVSADFRRQETALLKKLEKLQSSRDKNANFSNSNSQRNIFSRRHSSPHVEKTFITRSNSVLSTSPTHMFSHSIDRKSFTSNRERKMSNSSEGGNSQGSCESPGEEVYSNKDSILSRQCSRNGNIFSIVEARRRSHDIQEETSKLALQKLEMIVSGNKRRATIAEGATYSSLLPPSSELLNRLSRANSDSNDDQDD